MPNIVNLTFDVSKQHIKRTDAETVASGAINTLVANFSFCQTWDGLYKFCRFEGAGGVKDVRITDNKCVIPWEVIEAPSFTMACYGTVSSDVQLTTKKLPVKVYQSVNFIADEPLPPTGELIDWYENYVANEVPPMIDENVVEWLGNHPQQLTLEADRSYPTVADMKADLLLANGMICRTLGFHSAGDGGAAWYQITASGTANGMDVIACQNSKRAVMVNADNEFNVECFGASVSNDDNGAYFKRAFDYAIENDCKLNCAGNGTYTFETPISINSAGKLFRFDGGNCVFSNFQLSNNYNNGTWITPYTLPNGSYFKNMQLSNNDLGNTAFLIGCPFEFENIHVKNTCKSFFASVSDYLDYMKFNNIKISSFDSSDDSIKANGLGDQWTFRDMHVDWNGGTGNTVKIKNRNSTSFEHCLNVKVEITSHSIISFNDCHFEDGGVTVISDTASATFNGCFFWGNAIFPVNDKIVYTGCKFLEGVQTYNKKTTSNDYKNMVGYGNMLEIEDNWALYPDFGYRILSQDTDMSVYRNIGWDCISGIAKITDSHIDGIEVGEYNYTVQLVPYHGTTTPVKTQSKAVSITGQHTFVNLQVNPVSFRGFVYNVYRENTATGKIEVAYNVVTCVNGGYGRIIDWGNSINGVIWETVQEVPTVIAPCSVSNGILYATTSNMALLNKIAGFSYYDTTTNTLSIQPIS